MLRKTCQDNHWRHAHPMPQMGKEHRQQTPALSTVHRRAGRLPCVRRSRLLSYSFVIPGSDSDSEDENAAPPQQAGNADNNDGPVMQISGNEVSDVDFNSEIDSDDTGLDDEEFYDCDGSPDTRNRVDAGRSEPKNSSRVAKILNRDYDVEIVKNVLPPVSERLAKTMSDWLQIASNRDKVKECFSETASLMPENIEGLKSVKINELLYQKLPFKAKVNDQRIRGINSYFTRGTGPLIAILDNLIDFEASMKTYTTKTVDCDNENATLKLKDSSLNLTQIRRYLHCAIKILSFRNAICLQKRKSLLKVFLDNRYHYLIKPTNPVTEELLGPDLEQKISESNKIMEVAKKIYFNNKQRRPFRCARSMSFQSRQDFGYANNANPNSGRHMFHQKQYKRQ